MNPGQRLNHYEISDKLGQGGMGEVFRARDTKLGREVAIKLLPTELTAEPERHARFHREAQVLASFSHPHVASIFSLEEDQGRHFLVMELIEGEDLSDRIRRGPLPPDEALEIARQIASALEAAHAMGIVHRDLKPANVKLTPSGQVKVLDFGLAKVREDGALEPGHTDFHDSPTLPPDMTRRGVILGTAAYMSPEQARGQAVDRRSDIWALGCVLYEMLAGQPVFRGDTVSDTLAAVLRNEPDPELLPADLPVPVRRLVRRCLRKDPHQRLHDVADARIVIEDVLAEQDPSSVSDLSTFGAAPTDAPPTGTSPSPRRPRRGLMVVGVLGWLVAASLLWFWRGAEDTPNLPTRIDTLTFSGRDWAPSASPDGSVIAFVSDRTGTPRIWLKQMAGGSEAPLTDGPDDLPRFSPDGSHILFVRDEADERHLYRVPVLGGQPRKLLDDAVEADWSPDGQHVAFLRMESEESGDNLFHVMVAEIQSARERVLASFENRNTYGIRWSPDGARISVCLTSLTGNVAEASRVAFVAAEGGEVEQLELTAWWGPFCAPEWSPDGRSMIIAQAADELAHVADLPSQMMQFELEANEVRPLFWAPLRLPRSGWGFSAVTALDADRIVFDEEIGRAELHEVDLARAGEPTSTRVLTSSLGRDRQPAYSPDGRQVIFSSNRSGNIDLWSIDRETGEIRQLTDDPSDDWDPAFTPDGERILWSSTRTGNLEIWMANADGSAARQVSRDGVDAENPTMTADGAWIVYSSNNDAKRGIWRIRPDGSDAARIVGAASLLPEVSPDGRLALYVVFRDLNFQIRVVEIATGEILPFRISIDTIARHQTVTFGRGRWWPDGRAIVFIGENEAGRPGVLVQDFARDGDTRATRRELAGFGPDLLIESLGLSPDGRHLAVSAVEEQRVLKLARNMGLENWRRP